MNLRVLMWILTYFWLISFNKYNFAFKLGSNFYIYYKNKIVVELKNLEPIIMYFTCILKWVQSLFMKII